MVAAMRHRGPDDSGLFWDEKVSMGMARLAVIDLNPTRAPADVQPGRNGLDCL